MMDVFSGLKSIATSIGDVGRSAEDFGRQKTRQALQLNEQFLGQEGDLAVNTLKDAPATIVNLTEIGINKSSDGLSGTTAAKYIRDHRDGLIDAALLGPVGLMLGPDKSEQIFGAVGEKIADPMAGLYHNDVFQAVGGALNQGAGVFSNLSATLPDPVGTMFGAANVAAEALYGVFLSTGTFDGSVSAADALAPAKKAAEGLAQLEIKKIMERVAKGKDAEQKAVGVFGSIKKMRTAGIKKYLLGGAQGTLKSILGKLSGFARDYKSIAKKHENIKGIIDLLTLSSDIYEKYDKLNNTKIGHRLIDTSEEKIEQAFHLSEKAIRAAGHSATEELTAGRNWLKNKSVGVEQWAGDSAHSAGRWLGDKGYDASHWTLQHRAQIGDKLHLTSSILGGASAGLGIVAGGLALTGVGLPAAAVLGTLSLTLAAASAAAEAWYAVTKSVGTIDGSVTTGEANHAAAQAAKNLALTFVSVELASARAVTKAKTMLETKNALSFLHSDPRTVLQLDKATKFLNRLPGVNLGMVFRNASLAKRLKIGDLAMKVAQLPAKLASMGGIAGVLQTWHRVENKALGLGRQGKAMALAAVHAGRQAFQKIGRGGLHLLQNARHGLTSVGHGVLGHLIHLRSQATQLAAKAQQWARQGVHQGEAALLNGLASALRQSHALAASAGVLFGRSRGRFMGSVTSGFAAALGHNLLAARSVLGFLEEGGHPSQIGSALHEVTHTLSAVTYGIAGALTSAFAEDLHHAGLPHLPARLATPSFAGHSFSLGGGFPSFAFSVPQAHSAGGLHPESALKMFGSQERAAAPSVSHFVSGLRARASSAVSGTAHSLPSLLPAAHGLVSAAHAAPAQVGGLLHRFMPHVPTGRGIPPRQTAGLVRSAAHATHALLSPGLRMLHARGLRRALPTIPALSAVRHLLPSHLAATLPTIAAHPLTRLHGAEHRAQRAAHQVADHLPKMPVALAHIGHGLSHFVQRSGRGDHPDIDPTALRADLKRQSGGFLPDGNVRAKLGGHLGFDPGGARLHTGPAAASAARRLSAEAFTIGSDVFFGEGRFDPHTPKGLGLIAHELTHVGQQTGTTGDGARFFSERGGDEMEREAQRAAQNVLANVGDRSGLFVEDYVREYEGEGGLTQADQRRLDHISLLALQGAQRLLPEGRVEAGKLGEMDIQVALDLSGMSDDEAASVWSEAIVAAVQGRRSDHGTRLQEGLKQQIQKWDSFEHFEIGNEAKGGPSAGIFLDCFDRDFPAAQRNAPPATWPAPWRGMSGDQQDALQNGLKYGDIVALSGDFYESSQVLDDPSKHGIPDPTTNFAALNTAPLREIMDLLPLIRRGSGTPPGQPVQHATTEELQAATGGRYLLLAKNNPVHFTNPPEDGGTFTGTNIQQWQGMHRQAIVAAMNGNANLAWGINAAADHFLTDAFSSGHARTPRTKLMTSDTANFQSAVLHDLDNDFGVDMANPRGDHWVAFGDDNYHDSKSPADTKNAANRKFVLEAASLSKEDIAAALTQGAAFSVPLRFASEQIVPHAVDLTHDRWTGRQDNPLLALAALTASSATSLGLNLLLLTDYQREVLHLAGSEGPGILTGAAGDTLIRDWVQRQSVPALSRQPGGAKMRMINRLMEGNISDEDVDAIEKLSGSVLTEEEMRVIRDDVTPQLPAVDRFKFGTAHRVRIRAAVNRIPVPPPVAPGLPPPVAPGLAEAPADTQEPGDAGTHLRSPRFRGDVDLEEVLHNKKVLRMGSSGRPIEKIQGALIDSGFALPRFGADSLFGRETGAAVAGFQTENDLAPVDGIVGPITMRSLDTLQSASPPPSRGPLRRPASGLSSPGSSPTAVPTVDVRATHIGGALSKLPVWHLFVVTTNAAGQQRFYRGGPGGAGQPPYGTIKTTFGPYVPGTVDWNPSAPSANVLSGPAAADKDSSLAAEMRRIDGSAVNYQPLGPNSNTVASTMLHKTGIAASKPVWLAPGWDQPDL